MFNKLKPSPFAALLWMPILLLFTQLSWAQLATQGPPEAETSKVILDPFGRSTPRGTVKGYIRAIAENDYDKAARYFDVSDRPLGERKAISRTLAKQLNYLLDRDGLIFDLVSLSDAVEGKGGDNLDVNIDQVGLLDRSLRKVPLLLESVKGQGETSVWLVSKETLKRVPFLLQVSKESILDRLLPESLKQYKIGSVSVGHWAAIAVVALIALGMGYLFSWVLIFLLRKILARRTDIPGHGVLGSIVFPLAVFIGVSLYRVMVLSLGVEVVARKHDTTSLSGRPRPNAVPPPPCATMWGNPRSRAAAACRKAPRPTRDWLDTRPAPRSGALCVSQREVSTQKDIASAIDYARAGWRAGSAVMPS